MAKLITLPSYKFIYFFVLCTLVALTQSAPDDALVTQLPGFSATFSSNNYSGYVNIDQNHGQNLFYYFVESERNPSDDPLVLWFNGGPGCSSFDGFVYEHGKVQYFRVCTPLKLCSRRWNTRVIHNNVLTDIIIEDGLVVLSTPPQEIPQHGQNESSDLTLGMKLYLS